MAPDIGAYESGGEFWVPGAGRAGGVITSTPTFFASSVRAQIIPTPSDGVCSVNFTISQGGDML